MPPSPAYDHVVFDLDGTLADTRTDLVTAVNHVLAVMQLPALPFATICEFVGEGARRLLQRSVGPDHQDRIEEALALFLSYYRAHLLDHTVLYPSVTEVIRTLTERGLTLSLLSNKPEELSRAILEGLGLLPSFSAVVGGDSLPERKPDPAGINHLLRTTRTLRDRTVLVGDSAIDLQTARAAGIAFCGVAWGIRPHELLESPDQPRVIRHAEDLLAVVEGGV